MKAFNARNLSSEQAFLEALYDEIDRCQFWIENALDRSARSHHFQDVKDMIMRGDAHLWSTENGCCITCFSTFPATKMLQLWLLGGDFEEVYADCSDKIEKWARENGCDQLFVNGRKGWERRLKDRGYTYAATILTKEIEHASQ
jgi:hypothetical protein